VLLLNPGFSYVDYFEEYEVEAFRQRRIDNLAQNLDGVEFPFSGLDPEFCWGGSYRWWEGKLHDIVVKIADRQFGNRYREALQFVAKHIAHMELVPYHSSGFNSAALIKKLPSAQMAKSFFQNVLLPDAKAGRRTVIVTRQATAWGVSAKDKTADLIVYEGGQTRGASLGPRTTGGQAILRRFGIRSSD
jgi:hypothetical protein